MLINMIMIINNKLLNDGAEISLQLYRVWKLISIPSSSLMPIAQYSWQWHVQLHIHTCMSVSSSIILHLLINKVYCTITKKMCFFSRKNSKSFIMCIISYDIKNQKNMLIYKFIYIKIIEYTCRPCLCDPSSQNNE